MEIAHCNQIESTILLPTKQRCESLSSKYVNVPWVMTTNIDAYGLPGKYTHSYNEHANHAMENNTNDVTSMSPLDCSKKRCELQTDACKPRDTAGETNQQVDQIYHTSREPDQRMPTSDNFYYIRSKDVWYLSKRHKYSQERRYTKRTQSDHINGGEDDDDDDEQEGGLSNLAPLDFSIGPDLIPTLDGFADVPNVVKNDNYWENRQKNNESAKRSRNKRRAREYLLQRHALSLEQENDKLRRELSFLRTRCK